MCTYDARLDGFSLYLHHTRCTKPSARVVYVHLYASAVIIVAFTAGRTHNTSGCLGVIVRTPRHTYLIRFTVPPYVQHVVFSPHSCSSWCIVRKTTSCTYGGTMKRVRYSEDDGMPMTSRKPDDRMKSHVRYMCRHAMDGGGSVFLSIY